MENTIKETLDKEVKLAADQMGEDFETVKDYWSAYKSGGAKGFAKSVPGLWESLSKDPELAKDISANRNKGTKTSEYWVTLILLSLCSIAFAAGSQDTAVLAAGISVAAYIGSRSWIKGKREDAKKVV